MLCEHCNRLIGINDSVCPYCGEKATHSEHDDKGTETSSIVEPIPELNAGSDVLESINCQNDISFSTYETDHIASGKDSLEEIEETHTTHSQDILAEDNLIEDEVLNEEVGRRNALEESSDTRTQLKNNYKASKLLIAVAILSVLALFSSIVLFILLPKQQQSKQDAEIIDLLEGAWISNYFAFYDSTSKDYVEVLTIDADGGFTMLYTVPDEKFPDGWRNGKWRIIEQIDGTIKYIKDEDRLLLLYNMDGTKACFERFFISKEESIICLREYYDETGDSYYDVILHRINIE